MRYTITPALCLFCFLLLAPHALAQDPATRDMEREQALWAELEKLAPGEVATFTSATEAMDAGEHDRAAELFAQVAAAAPTFDPAIRRLGSSLVNAGEIEKGRAELERAVKMMRSPENLSSLARGLAFADDTPEADRQRALDLAREAFRANKRDDDPYYAFLLGSLAADIGRESDLREAAKHLSANFPEKLETHYLLAISAAYAGDTGAAEREIREAERLGLPREAVEHFLAAIEQPSFWSYVKLPVYLVLAWAGGILVLFVAGKLLSAATLRWMHETDPNSADADNFSLRSVYRWVINVAGIYYYLSLPVVVLLVVGAAGAIFLGFLALGWIPIKLVFFLGLGALVTVFYVVRSLFVRPSDEEPGRPVGEQEAPGLWRLTREVARAVGTRPVDEIRITVGTDLAVYETGSMRDRMQDRGRRVLLLGLGVVSGFKVNDFRAVLAHEYGHFQNRDTAGGDVALRVRMSMAAFAQGIVESGQATIWNVGLHFLRLYDFVFRRISHGATRLQEVLADRTAVRLYGASAFESGLSHVIRRSVEFDFLASREIEDALRSNRAMSNLYAPPEIKGTDDERTIHKLVQEVLNQPTTPDDTHPAPGERILLAKRIRSAGTPGEDGMVWDLFANGDALAEEMCTAIERNIRAAAAR